MRRTILAGTYLIASIAITTSEASAEDRLCVKRLSIVEPASITVLEVPEEGAESVATKGTDDGPNIEYADNTKSTDSGIVEYGDQRVERAGLDVTRGDDEPSTGAVQITRGDESDDSDLVFRGDDARTPTPLRLSPGGGGELDLLGAGDDRGDTGAAMPSPFAAMLGLDPTGMPPGLFALEPQASGFGFRFDDLRFRVMQTPAPKNLAEALGGLQPREGERHVRIDAGKNKDACVPATFQAKKGRLELETRQGHRLVLTFPGARKVKNATKAAGASVYRFDRDMTLQAKMAKSTTTADERSGKEDSGDATHPASPR